MTTTTTSLSMLVALLALAFSSGHAEAGGPVRACSMQVDDSDGRYPPNNKPCAHPDLWAIWDEAEVGPGAYAHVDWPSCMASPNYDNIDTVIRAAATSAGFNEYAGPLAALLRGPLVDAVMRRGGDIPGWLNPYYGQEASCRILGVTLPVGATVWTYRLMGAETDPGLDRGWNDCSTSEVPGYAEHWACGMGFSRFEFTVKERKTAGHSVVFTNFMNWSADRTRRGRLVVFFMMPPGSLPAGGN